MSGISFRTINWKIWIFSIELNIAAIYGTKYLKSIGIDRNAYRLGS